MNALEKLKLTKSLKIALQARQAASSPLQKLKALKQIKALRLKLGMKEGNDLTERYQELNLPAEPTAKPSKAQRAAYYTFDEQRTKSQRQKDNNAVFALLDELDAGTRLPENLTEHERQILAKYSGNGGGLKGRDGKIGSAHEYYTPAPIATAMWDSLKEMGFAGGRVLDPCAGTGIFGALSPDNVVVDAVELDATSAAVNRYVNGSDVYSVQNKPFEEVAAATDDEIYDAVVTNVPFGNNASRIAKNKDSKYRTESLEGYFVLRSLDKLKPRGLAAFLVPASFMDTKTGNPAKVRLASALKAEFMGAYRLPSKVFSSADTGADVVTDIVFFRKFSRDVAQKIEELQEQNPRVLAEANVLWDDYLNGRYFKGEGKKYIFGTEAKRKNRFGKMADTVLSDDSIGNIAKAIRGFGQSRINWDLLDASETIAISYNDGDTVYRDGQTMVWNQGEFVVQAMSDNESDSMADAVMSQLDSALQAFESKVTFDGVRQAVLHYRATDRGNYVPAWVNNALIGAESSKNPAKQFALAVVGLAVKEAIDTNAGDESFNFLKQYDTLSDAMKSYAQIGIHSKMDKTIRDAVKTMKSHYHKNNYSAFWRGERGSLEREHTVEQHIEAAQYRKGDLWLTVDEIKAINPDFDIFADDDWAVSADGQNVIRLDDLFVGNYGEMLAKLDADIANAATPEIAAKLARVKMLAASRVNTIDVDKLRFGLRSPYITPEEVAEFLNTLNPKPSKVFVAQSEGKRYADIENTGDADIDKLQNRLGDYIKNGTLTLGGVKWNTYKNKEEAIKALRDLVNETNTLFNTWVHANPQIMARVKAQAQNPDNIFFEQASDESPLEIDGLSTDWHLHGYQAAFVRQQNRFFGGINGFDVGLGKTFTALSAVQYAQNVGTRKKTLFVVPNSVLSNWHKEAVKGDGGRKGVYDEATAARCLFVGADIVDGELKVKSSNYSRDLNRILDNEHDKVFMSFEAFEKIRLKTETAEDYASFLRRVDSSFAALERKSKDEKNQSRINNLISILTDGKLTSAPFLEDMGFDSVVIDEAHAFKNSKRTYEFGANTKGLGNLKEASNRGVDASAKTWYLRGERGDGVLLLTATPITNSPLEIYSMMSLAAGEERVNKHMLGVTGADAFMEVSCALDNRDDYTVTGDFRPTNMFVGLKNTEVLRNLIDGIATIKSANDVGLTLRLPNADEEKTKISLSQSGLAKLSQYKAAYRAARKYLEDEHISPTDWELLQDISRRFGEPIELLAQPFNLIRKMDALIIDEEMDERASFYNIDSGTEEAQAAIDAFNKLGLKEARTRKPLHTSPQNIVSEKILKDKDDGSTSVEYIIKVQAWINDDGRILLDSLDFNVQQKLEALLESSGAIISVNTPPKLAALAVNVKNEQAHIRAKDAMGNRLENAKQIVFCDELALHNKIKRILTSKAGIPSAKITFISGQFNAKPEETLEVQNGFNADGEANRFCLVIANKKAEVGINLQKGTQAIHHLTIPWTPDSITQRNGRGVRQGNKTELVKVYYYDADGTFDSYRRNAVERKGQWISNLMNKSHDGIVETTGVLTNEEYDRILLMDGSATDMEAIQHEFEENARQSRIIAAKQSQIINLKIFRDKKNFIELNSEYLSWASPKIRQLEGLFNEVFSASDRLSKSMDKGASEKTIKGNQIKYEKAKEDLLTFADLLQGSVEIKDDNSTYSGSVRELMESKIKAGERYFNFSLNIKFLDVDCPMRQKWSEELIVAKNMMASADAAMKQDAKIEGAYSIENLDVMKDGYIKLADGRILTKRMVGMSSDKLFFTDIIYGRCDVYMVEINQPFYGLGVRKVSDYVQDVEMLSIDDPNAEVILKSFAERDAAIIRNNFNGDINKARNSFNVKLFSKMFPEVAQLLPEFETIYSFDSSRVTMKPPYFPLVLAGKLVENMAGWKELAEKQREVGFEITGFPYQSIRTADPDKFSEEPFRAVDVLIDGMKAFGLRIVEGEYTANRYIDDLTLSDTNGFVNRLVTNFHEAIDGAVDEADLVAKAKAEVIEKLTPFCDVPTALRNADTGKLLYNELENFGASDLADLFKSTLNRLTLANSTDKDWFYMTGNTYKLHQDIGLRTVIKNEPGNDMLQIAFVPRTGGQPRMGDESRIKASGATRNNIWVVTGGGMKLLQEKYSKKLLEYSISFEPV